MRQGAGEGNAARRGDDEAERLEFAFRRCLARSPYSDETAVLLTLLNEQRVRFAAGEINPLDLAAPGSEQPPDLPAGATPADLAAWTGALLSEIEVVSPGAGPRILQATTRDQRHLLQAAGFYSHFPWSLAW